METEILIDAGVGTLPGEISAASVKQQLARAGGGPIVCRIHSEGGLVFEGFAIYDAFKAYRGAKRCVVESAAFSIASFVAMAFDDIEISSNGYLMLHNPMSDVAGDASAHASQATLLEKLRRTMVSAYAQRTRKSPSHIESMMSAETFLDASEALANGFVSRVTGTTTRAVARLSAMMRRSPQLTECVVARSRTTVSAKAQWDSQVLAKNAMGMTSDKAVLAVNRENPGLRLKMLDETNGRSIPEPPRATASQVMSFHPIGITRADRISNLVDRVINQAILEDKRR